MGVQNSDPPSLRCTKARRRIISMRSATKILSCALIGCCWCNFTWVLVYSPHSTGTTPLSHQTVMAARLSEFRSSSGSAEAPSSSDAQGENDSYDSTPRLLDHMVRGLRAQLTSEIVYAELILEGKILFNQTNSNETSSSMPSSSLNHHHQEVVFAAAVIEVGMHKLGQCLRAAKAGFQAHCFEPSPVSYERILRLFSQHRRQTLRQKIHLYNTAVGSTSNDTITFFSKGSTGDKVVTTEQLNSGEIDKTMVVQVPTLRMDDFISDKLSQQEVFLAKIDTQGYEPHVIRGLNESLQGQKIHYLLMEYWPRGMDKLFDGERCTAPVATLRILEQAGYSLFQLGVMWHPEESDRLTNFKSDIFLQRPFHSASQNCEYLYKLEELINGTYFNQTFGYWTDILAVSPKAPIPTTPITRTGEVLRQWKMDT